MATHPKVGAILCASPKTLKIQDWFLPLAKVKFTDCAPFRFFRHTPDPSLKEQLRIFNPDILFIPVARHFRFGKVPIVTMVQNMAPLIPHKNHNLRETMRQAALRIEARIAVKKAVKIIAMSDFVRDFLVEKWRVPPKKIAQVYFGVNPPAKTHSKPDIIPKTWKEGFLFTAGMVEPYKGLEDIILAVEYLKTTVKRPIKLVIAGAPRTEMISYHKKLKQWIIKKKLSSDILWTGDLNEAGMAWCYANCTAFVTASRIESLGLVSLEALSHGCSCIATNTPPMAEVFKNTAVYYTPGDFVSLAGLIQKVSGWDNETIIRKAARAKSRALEFSWDVTAQKTAQTLETAIKSRR